MFTTTILRASGIDQSRRHLWALDSWIPGRQVWEVQSAHHYRTWQRIEYGLSLATSKVKRSVVHRVCPHFWLLQRSKRQSCASMRQFSLQSAFSRAILFHGLHTGEHQVSRLKSSLGTGPRLTWFSSMFTGTALGGKILEVSHNQYRNLIVFATVAYMACFVCLIWAKFVCAGRDKMWSKM